MVGNLLILLAGLAVYAGYGWAGLLYLATATLLSYALGRLIPKHRWVMWIGVGLNVLALAALRLSAVLPWDLAAPLGISYFTLQIIAYLADLYRGSYPPETNLLNYALYVTYLPHIFLGPIESFPTMRGALSQRKITWDGLSQGGARMLWGAFKKLVIAARVNVIVSAIAADPAAYRGAYALAAMLLYSVELYADFSGGMDLALGGSQMLGLRLSENFNAPFLSQSVQEFWRRWHITLGAWLRSYVYIPLGGNRKGKVRKVFNCLVTFLISGLWHGGQYLLWGLLNGIFVSFGTKLQTKWKTLNRVMTFLVISLLWSFFIWPDTATALRMLLSLVTSFRPDGFLTAIGAMGLTAGDWTVLIISTALLFLADWKRDPIRERAARFCPAARVAVIGALALAVLVFGRYGIGFVSSEFIYSRF